MICCNECFGKKEEEGTERNSLHYRTNKILIKPVNNNNEATTEACQKLYLSLQEVMQKLNNIVNKQPGKNTEEVKEFFTNIAQEHDQQIAEINNMKNKINDITNGTKDIEELKGLKKHSGRCYI